LSKQLKMKKNKIIGISKGIIYNLIDADLSNNTGLIDSVWGNSVWCKFDKIII
jgi:hypothetical protein